MKKWLKWTAGIAVSAGFMYLAFRKADFAMMWTAIKKADYIWLFPAITAMFASYWLRSLRWRYLMAPIKRINTPRLFQALLIGYMANSFLPAHLGELVRAYIIGQKENLPSSTVFASIIVERVADVFSLIAVMGLTILAFPFPGWVRQSGWLFLAIVASLFAILLFLKNSTEKGPRLISVLLKFLPQSLQTKITASLATLLDGIVPLKKKNNYLKVFLLTVAIWFCYAATFYMVFFSFGFNRLYRLGWTAALVLLVMTTIGVLIPSSPGYIGVFHFLCQTGLGFFAVPASESLSYAFIMHGINFIPVVIVGLILTAISGRGLVRIKP